MPSRIHTPSKAIASILRCRKPRSCRQYATAAAATYIPAASRGHINRTAPPTAKFPSTQPPSYKPPEFRKSQLLRQYASLLRSTPLMLLFQHNNLKSNEWVGIRRELSQALRKVDQAHVAAGNAPLNLADGIKLEIIQTGIFDAALRVVEFYKPDSAVPLVNSSDPATKQTAEDQFTHVLSKAAHTAVGQVKTAHALSPLLSGPLVLLTFPEVSPQHLKAALSNLSPSQPLYPAPTRRANPGWHDPMVQSGVQKLILLGARVDGTVFDVEGAKWVGSIPGGLDGLRGQLVAMLQSLGGAVTNTLESAAKNLYFTVEGRRTMLEDEAKGPDANKAE